MSTLRIKDAQLLPNVNGAEKIPTGGRGDYAVSVDQIKVYVQGDAPQQIEGHINNTENPHQVTKKQVGLGNVENTADLDKPVSTAMQAALDLKANQSTTYTKTEVDGRLGFKADKTYVDSQDLLKADKTYVDSALAGFSNGAAKFYPTLAAANADIANIALKDKVEVGEIANGGTWYKATAGVTTLTKSPYDPLTQAKADATTKADLAEANAKSYTDLKVDDKFDQIVVSKNLFDATKVKAGYALNTMGIEVVSVGNNVSDFIHVKEGVLYSRSATGISAWYDSQKAFLSQWSSTNSSAPTNAAYLRVTVSNTNLPTYYLKEGMIDSSADQFKEVAFLKNVQLSQSDVIKALTPEFFKGDLLNISHVSNIKALGQNLLDENNSTPSTRLTFSEVGGVVYHVLSFSTTDNTSELIQVKPNTDYIYTTSTRTVQFDENMNIVAYSAQATMPNSEFRTHALAKYVQFSYSKSTPNKMFGEKSKFLLTQSGVPSTTTYVKPNEKRLEDVFPSSSLSGKKCLWMGTSIPWGGGHPERACAILGMDLLNVAQGLNRIRAFSSNNVWVTQEWLVKMFTLTKADVDGRYGAMLGKTVKANDYLVEDAAGVILTQAMLDALTEWSFESKVAPVIQDYDVFVLEFAVNDINGQSGEFELAKDAGTNRSTYAGAYGYVINAILTTKPTARIILVSHFTTDNAVYASASKFVAAQIDIAKHWNLPIVNLSESAGINSLTKSLTRGNDGIHFNPGSVLYHRVVSAITSKFIEFGF